LSVQQTARLFALLNVAMADAAIATWDAKYVYNLWRPITAIQQADSDDNPDTIADPNWSPLLNTPAFPEYVSGHSTFSAAAATVLARFFGTDHVFFTVGSDSVPGVTRSYTSFAHTAEEIALSRIYGGIHFLAADLDGLSMGRAIGEHVDNYFFLPLGGTPAVRIAASTNDTVMLEVIGTPNALCVVQTSTNLVDWIGVHTNYPPFSIAHPSDTSRRFYRARLPR
jgi:hypothetical protein